MLELLLFLILLVVCGAAVLLGNYFRVLFSDGRAEYSRSELLTVKVHLVDEWKELMGDDMATAAIGLGLGTFLGLLFSYMGGDGGGANGYFFHSALLPGLWYLALPSLKEQFALEVERQSFVGKLVGNDVPYLFGFSMATMAQNFAVYGLYNKINFLWVLLNNLAIAGLVVYRFYQSETEVGASLPPEAPPEEGADSGGGEG